MMYSNQPGNQTSGDSRSKPEYNWPPPNPKYASSPEYQEGPRYVPPYRPPAFYQPPVVITDNYISGPNFFLRAIWFVLVGWWLGILWLIAGYAFCTTILGLPLGLIMINRLPQVLTLRPSSARQSSYIGADGSVYTQTRYVPQVDFFIRAIYYLFVGWWLGILWSIVGYGLCVLIIPLPLGLVMLNCLPGIMTLRRN